RFIANTRFVFDERLSPDQPRKIYPELGCAVTVTLVPAEIQGPSVAVTVPPTEALVDSRYSVLQFQMMEEKVLSVNEISLAEPLAGTAPTPLQPVETRRTPGSDWTS